jgi:hypothetical protein
MPFSKIAILGASGSLAQAPYHCFRCGAGGNALDAAIRRVESRKPRLSSSGCERPRKRRFIACARAQNLVSGFGAKPRVG